jgi:hypothetical protein
LTGGVIYCRFINPRSITNLEALVPSVGDRFAARLDITTALVPLDSLLYHLYHLYRLYHQLPNHPTNHPTAKMPKDSSFRLCILILLIIQTTIWALTLLDLMHPGRPIALVRSTVDVVATLFAKQPSAVLVYRDFRARI